MLTRGSNGGCMEPRCVPPRRASRESWLARYSSSRHHTLRRAATRQPEGVAYVDNMATGHHCLGSMCPSARAHHRLAAPPVGMVGPHTATLVADRCADNPVSAGRDGADSLRTETTETKTKNQKPSNSMSTFIVTAGTKGLIA